MKLALCHPSDAHDFEVAPRFSCKIYPALLLLHRINLSSFVRVFFRGKRYEITTTFKFMGQSLSGENINMERTLIFKSKS